MAEHEDSGPAYRWVKITDQGAFAPRDGAGALVFKNRMWLLGGWSPRAKGDKEHFPRTCNNEVWSSRDGASWRLEKANSFIDDSFDPTKDWEGRHTAGYVVFRDRMWIVGGDTGQGHYQNDVWASADGKRWECVTFDAPWGPRVLHYTVAFKGRIWVMGGQTLPQFAPEEERFYDDVWSSADGRHWEKMDVTQPAWPQRGMIGGSVVFKDRMWILGGGTYDTPNLPSRLFFNDVWSSSDGVRWERHLEHAPWSPRQYHDVAVFDGKMWVLEGAHFDSSKPMQEWGKPDPNRNDVWYSDDGIHWHELLDTPWKPRHAASVFTHDFGLWVVAGNNKGRDVWNDVWKLERAWRTKPVAKDMSAVSNSGPALERNIARLHASQPGADRAMAWRSCGSSLAIPALNDGDTTQAAALPRDMPGVGIEWPIQHVVDGAALFLSGAADTALQPAVEFHDGVQWTPVVTDLRGNYDADTQCWRYTFEPIATRSLRIRLPRSAPPPTEIEVYRYIPAGPTVWPDRLVRDNQLEKEILASGREPSYETLAACALSMSPAHAVLGLKDHPREIGVTWDGRLVSPKFDPQEPLHPQNTDYKGTHYGRGHYSLSFMFGDRQATLADYRETVTRTLIDGWRPGTVVAGRIDDLAVRQTAFMGFADSGRTRPALFVRMEVTNLADKRMTTSVIAQLLTKSADVLRVTDGCLADDNWLALVPSDPPRDAGLPNSLRFDLDLAPGQTRAVTVVQPHGQTPLDDAGIYRSVRFDAALVMFKCYWDEILAPAMTLDLPEARTVNLYKAVLAQIFLNADGDIMPYGSEPSTYAGNLYGIEEGYAMMALAFAGFGADAQRYMSASYLDAEYLKKAPEYKLFTHRHQQNRNGLSPSYAVSAYRFTRDKDWIGKHLPLLRRCADWTIENRHKTMVSEKGEKPLHWGLLPAWSYGGDLSDLQCYALYANFACWKGLSDTAWILEELGDRDAARRYREEAADYRACLDRAVEGAFLANHKPPCLPLQLYATEPNPKGINFDFYNCMAPILLGVPAFEHGGRHERFVTDYLEQTNRLFCLMPRLRDGVGAGGLDGIYGMGNVLSKLRQGKTAEFLLAFYGYQAFNMERETFVSRETNVVYASDLHVRSCYEEPDTSDPLPCASAVVLHYLRHMLVTEELDGPGGFSGNLLLLFGTPRAWFRDGGKIAFSNVPTHFGKMSCTVISDLSRDRIRTHILPPSRNAWKTIVLHLRHPDSLPIQRVTVNGEPWKDVDAGRDLIRLGPGSDIYLVEAVYE